jgi:hypothetical protein
MKKFGIILLLTSTILQGFGQEVQGEKQYNSMAADSNENTKIVIGRERVVVEDDDDSFQVRIGNRRLSILESLEGKKKLSIDRYDEPRNNEDDMDEENNSYRTRDNEYSDDTDNYSHREDEDTYDRNTKHNWDRDYEDSHIRGARRFKGHWSGFEFGFNNYNFVNTMDLPSEISYMELHSGKSNSFNLNFSQVSLGIFRHLGIVTGLGVNWNNYVFSGDNNIVVGGTGAIEELIPAGDVPLKKSKFSTLYLNVPAILEVQLPTGEGHRLNIGAGVIGGIKIGSHTKMVYEDKQKFKSNSDLNLNLLRAGVTGRIGYQNLMIYGTYYLTPWFEDNKGPGFYNLEPFEIGIAFTFND